MIIKRIISIPLADFANCCIFVPMKTMILSALMLLTTITNAQEDKKVRVKLGISGVMFVTGAVVNIAKVYTKEPVYQTGSDVDAFLREKKTYDKSQKDLSVISSAFYGLGGISLLTIKINF